MRNAASLVIALSLAAAACGEKTAPPAPKPADQPAKPAEAEKPAAPADAPKPVEAPKPEPIPAAPAAPAARSTKDAKGHDWASHMGDIAFTFDSSAGAKRAEDEKRALMLYFTTPT